MIGENGGEAINQRRLLVLAERREPEYYVVFATCLRGKSLR
jgi:hypothetical protein